MKFMQHDFFKLRRDISKCKTSSRKKLYKELQQLKKCWIRIKKHFDELHVAILRAEAKECFKETTNRFLNGLNPGIAKHTHQYPHSDIEGMVYIAVEIENVMNNKRRAREKER